DRLLRSAVPLAVDQAGRLDQRLVLPQLRARRGARRRARRARPGPARRAVPPRRADPVRRRALDLGLPPPDHRGDPALRARLRAPPALAPRLPVRVARPRAGRRAGAAMIATIARRAGWTVVVVWFVVTATFLVTIAIPADPARALLGPHGTAEAVE